eukprot:3860041-Alexandrium_andersonii.AAC.1
MGWLTKSGHQLLARQLDAQGGLSSDSGPSEARTPVARSSAEVQRLRQSCRNTLHLVHVVLSDPVNMLQARIIYTLGEPFRIDHGLNCKRVRSGEGSFEYHLEQAEGAGLQPLNDCVQLLATTGALEHM